MLTRVQVVTRMLRSSVAHGNDVSRSALFTQGRRPNHAIDANNQPRGTMTRRIFSFVVALVTSVASSAAAQSHYPDRTIRALYGFPPGNDTAVRIIAEKLGDALGKPVIVDNIVGAAGNIAADRTARAAPDGYTIGILTGANIVIGPLLHSKLPYDPLKDLVPVSLAFRFENVVAVNNDVPAHTLAELVRHARASPGRLTFGHNGAGSVSHLSGELLKVMAKIDLRGVPYRGPSAILA